MEQYETNFSRWRPSSNHMHSTWLLTNVFQHRSENALWLETVSAAASAVAPYRTENLCMHAPSVCGFRTIPIDARSCILRVPFVRKPQKDGANIEKVQNSYEFVSEIKTLRCSSKMCRCSTLFWDENSEIIKHIRHIAVMLSFYHHKAHFISRIRWGTLPIVHSSNLSRTWWLWFGWWSAGCRAAEAVGGLVLHSFVTSWSAGAAQVSSRLSFSLPARGDWLAWAHGENMIQRMRAAARRGKRGVDREDRRARRFPCNSRCMRAIAIFFFVIRPCLTLLHKTFMLAAHYLFTLAFADRPAALSP